MAINLSMLLVTIIFVIMMFLHRFVFLSIKNFEQKNDIYTLINRLDETLQKTQNFNISFANDVVLINSEFNNIFMYSEKTIKLKNFVVVNNVTNFSFAIITTSGEKYNFINEQFEGNVNEDIIRSSKLKSIEIKFNINSHQYKYIYFNPDISVRRFINIG